ncbi:Glucose-methanol-choline (GMC) oxidoreductase:NAD binding site [Candidatus Rhodobacter oscarellae]|uniref:Glucose-methanol-choline (GMC) oxidoreductase:NAD binding site n=1 Tax=Candidatus Rhodobacter oscarellae TaxID=1675527 RepID=A0A0J9H4K9_9RHOB|nr:GMC family oxidoreductase [Candidatus Rhodobacter lobularis]KMW60588.1 Glucose-methanol-choline (GMC) oxidoreductase:NAD binding site [Candidatus Rhodobacter lobularis]
MFQTTTAEEAARASWDVVIAGSSFSAMFFLRGLPAGTRALIVEKGAIIPHEAQVAALDRPREEYPMDNRSEMPKDWIAHRMFGGNSNCWWGQVPRFHPNDFRMAELYGQGASWPIDYDDLEVFYGEVEDVMEVAGGGVDHILPRSRPFPYPPHALSRSDRACIDAMPDIWVPVACARANGGGRAQCCANGVCHLCPVDSKFSVLNGIDSFLRDGVHLLTGAEAVSVVINAGRAGGLVIRDGAGEYTISGGIVALGTNAISNAAILKRSGLTAPALGRYLHEQHSIELVIDVAAPGYFGGTSITGHCYGFYDGPHRAEAAAVLVENYNAPNDLRLTPGRWTDRMMLKLIAEDLPKAENRVELDENGAPRIIWTGHSAYAHAGLERAMAGIATILPFELEAIVSQRSAATEAHIQGTHRMGLDAASSVVNGHCETHEVSGLFALGSGVFPTSSAANPTLTLSAIALRAGRSV